MPMECTYVSVSVQSANTNFCSSEHILIFAHKHLIQYVFFFFAHRQFCTPIATYSLRTYQAHTYRGSSHTPNTREKQKMWKNVTITWMKGDYVCIKMARKCTAESKWNKTNEREKMKRKAIKEWSRNGWKIIKCNLWAQPLPHIYNIFSCWMSTQSTLGDSVRIICIGTLIAVRVKVFINTQQQQPHHHHHYGSARECERELCEKSLKKYSTTIIIIYNCIKCSHSEWMNGGASPPPLPPSLYMWAIQKCIACIVISTRTRYMSVGTFYVMASCAHTPVDVRRLATHK